jgi:hypothetical protein
MINSELRLLELFGSGISVIEIILIHNEHIIVPSIWRRAADDRIRSSKLRFSVNGQPWSAACVNKRPCATESHYSALRESSSMHVIQVELGLEL